MIKNGNKFQLKVTVLKNHREYWNGIVTNKMRISCVGFGRVILEVLFYYDLVLVYWLYYQGVHLLPSKTKGKIKINSLILLVPYRVRRTLPVTIPNCMASSIIWWKGIPMNSLTWSWGCIELTNFCPQWRFVENYWCACLCTPERPIFTCVA